MFTGLVEERGTIESVDELSDSVRLTVRGPLVTSDAGHGDSIAVNGVCLTVVANESGAFTADVMRETLVRSSLGTLAAGDDVNLERAARLDARIGGHLVQGHVDGTAEVLEISPSENWTLVRFSLPLALARYVVEKGSITVDGVSLTVVQAGDDFFTVSLIPETLTATTLGSRAVGDLVNLEVDAIAKYVERLMQWSTRDSR
ncbi:MAG: riboflavin synthase [Candidatus Nanopelagicales bacterium]